MACCAPPPALGGFIFLPGDILDWMNRLHGSIRQLQTDVQGSAVRDAFKSGYSAFVARWTQFYDAHQGWLSRTTGSTADEVAAYETEYNGWRAQYLAEPGNSGTLAQSAANEHGGLQPTPLLDGVTRAALIVGGVYLAVRILPPLLETRKGRR